MRNYGCLKTKLCGCGEIQLFCKNTKELRLISRKNIQQY